MQKALHIEAGMGHEGIVKLLLEKCAKVNPQGECHPLLQAAAFGGHEGIVKLPLEKGAEVNAQEDLLGMSCKQLHLGVISCCWRKVQK